MRFEGEISRFVNERKRGLFALRSIFQHIDMGIEVPKELRNEAVKYYYSEDVCNICQPDLIMIFDSDYYNTHKKELVVPHYGQLPRVFFAHLDRLPKVKFEGVRGSYFPLKDSCEHIDFIEMDSSEYFEDIDETKRVEMVRYFFEYRLSMTGEEYRDHIKSVKEAYVAFGIRTKYNLFDIMKAIRIRPSKNSHDFIF